MVRTALYAIKSTASQESAALAFKQVTLWDVIHRLAKNITFLINVYDNKHYSTKRKYSSIESRLDDFLWEGELDTMREKFEVESTQKNAKICH